MRKMFVSTMAMFLCVLAFDNLHAQSVESYFIPLGNTCVLFDNAVTSSPTYFGVRGECGIASNAVAVHVNVIVANPTSTSFVAVFDGGTAGGSVYPVLSFQSGEDSQVSAPVILCQPALECFGSDLGVKRGSGGSTDVVIVAEGYYVPVPVEE